MGKGWLGAGLLAVFLIFGICLSVMADTACLPTEDLLKQAAEKTLSGDFVEGIALGKEAQSRWEGQWNAIAAIADHEPMDEVDALFAEMEVYATTGEQPHFAACCEALARRIHSFADAHRFSWWNVL